MALPSFCRGLTVHPLASDSAGLVEVGVGFDPGIFEGGFIPDWALGLEAPFEAEAGLGRLEKWCGG